MPKYYFKDGYEGGTPIPKVIWWYAIETNYTGPLNALKCNEWYNNDLKVFFERHPEELYNIADIDFAHRTFASNMTDEEREFYRKEIKINE